MIGKVLAFDIEEKGLVLHCSENTEPDALNLKVFQRIPDTEGFSDEYQRNIREKLLAYYAEHICEEDMDSYLKQMDYRKFAEVDRTGLLEVLVGRGLYRQAMSVVPEYGYEGISIESQLKLTSRMLTRCEMKRTMNYLHLHLMYTDMENMTK